MCICTSYSVQGVRGLPGHKGEQGSQGIPGPPVEKNSNVNLVLKTCKLASHLLQVDEDTRGMMLTCCDPVTTFRSAIEQLKKNVSDARHVLVIKNAGSC